MMTKQVIIRALLHTYMYIEIKKQLCIENFINKWEKYIFQIILYRIFKILKIL